MTKPRSVNSITDAWFIARMVAGRVLADQNAGSLAQHRQNILDRGGYTNHREIPNAARAVAKPHGSNSE